MDDYEKYVEDRKTKRDANKRLLSNFKTWLKSSGLSKKTIDNHLSNIDFYLNKYLLYQDNTNEKKYGVDAVDMFLGYWFIKKAMWSTQSSIKNNAASFKKFYTFMYEKGLIDKDDLADLKKTIKEGMPEWLTTLKRYDDPSVEDIWL